MSSPFSLNPNNPFVHDEYYFLGKPGSYLYEESQIYTIRLIHHIILIVIGPPLCCFVFYLILCKSPARFLPYKKMFLLTAAVDVFILVQFLLVQAVGFLGVGKEEDLELWGCNFKVLVF